MFDRSAQLRAKLDGRPAAPVQVALLPELEPGPEVSESTDRDLVLVAATIWHWCWREWDGGRLARLWEPCKATNRPDWHRHFLNWQEAQEQALIAAAVEHPEYERYLALYEANVRRLGLRAPACVLCAWADGSLSRKPEDIAQFVSVHRRAARACSLHGVPVIAARAS